MEYLGKSFDEERALYGIEGAKVENCRFEGPADGESAMKECRDLAVKDCFFDLRYPFWHVTNADIERIEMTEKCRAAMWYDDGITIRDSKMNGIKALRECKNVALWGTDVVSPEFLWKCRGVKIKGGSLVSEYPLFECSDVEIEDFRMKGKYSFQYTENVTIKNALLDTKDAFWHAKNVTVVDSTIKGEYLAWYSENLHLVRCHISGTQPLCYAKGLVLEDCTMEGTDLAFEYSEVEATVKGEIMSVKNPVKGFIKADHIGEIIWDSARVSKENTVIEG